MSENKTTALATKNVGDQVIARVNQMCEMGFVLPKDYSVANAVKMSMLKIQDLKDKNGQSALAVCTQSSIQQALFLTVTKGLNAGLGQIYYIVRNNVLCAQESYFGKILQVKRIYPDFDPKPRVIYQGDEFEYETDVNNGRKKLVKHVQKIENLDNDFVGAYLYLPCPDGGSDLYIMTKKQIMAAWDKSSNKSQTTHKQFTDKMVSKTIINSGCNIIINSTPDGNSYAHDEDAEPEDVAYEEVTHVDVDALPEATPTERIEEPKAEIEDVTPQPTEESVATDDMDF